MITLALLKLLEENGFGKIGTDLFWQKIGADKQGVYISNIASGGYYRGQRKSQEYEIYCVYENQLKAMQKIESIAEFLRNNYSLDELPEVQKTKFKNIAIMPPTSISSVGLNAKGEMVYSISGMIYY